eukprot:1161047-Pelagomonas_calceolata.AAC.37
MLNCARVLFVHASNLSGSVLAFATLDFWDQRCPQRHSILALAAKRTYQPVELDGGIYKLLCHLVRAASKSGQVALHNLRHSKGRVLAGARAKIEDLDDTNRKAGGLHKQCMPTFAPAFNASTHTHVRNASLYITSAIGLQSLLQFPNHSIEEVMC